MSKNHRGTRLALCAAVATGALAAPSIAAAHPTSGFGGPGHGFNGHERGFGGQGAGLGAQDYDFDLTPVPHDPAADNGSNVVGAGDFRLRGRNLDARISATGLDPLPHAMHIHGKDAPELAFCPGGERRDEIVDDGLIETAEGLGDYGPIQVSLTVSGDTTPASALDLPRFPMADGAGVLNYARRIKIPVDVARRLAGMHVVIHGEDLNNDGVYGGRITALGAPLEAELPVACGEIAG